MSEHDIWVSGRGHDLRMPRHTHCKNKDCFISRLPESDIDNGEIVLKQKALSMPCPLTKEQAIALAIKHGFKVV